MSKLFKNKIDLEKGKIYSVRDENVEIGTGVDKDNYHNCDVTDVFGNRYYRVHDVIYAEGNNLPKHLWPVDENGKRFVINHIKDGFEYRTNNSINNLELISNADNLRYGDRGKKVGEALKNHKSTSKEVYQYTLDNKLIAIYPSIMEASRQTGFSFSKISQCCNIWYFDKRWKKWYEMKTYKGYKWSFIPL